MTYCITFTPLGLYSLQERLQVGFSTLREVILKRPATQQQLLQTLLELTTNEKEQARVQAIHSAKKLHTRPELAEYIEVKSISGLTELFVHRNPVFFEILYTKYRRRFM